MLCADISLFTQYFITKNSLISLSCCRRGGVEGHCGNHHRDGCHHLPAARGERRYNLRQVPELGPGVLRHPPPLRVVWAHLLLLADQRTPFQQDHTRERGGHAL